MSYGSRISFLNAKLFTTFAFVLSLAFLLMPESALAAVFNAQSPGISAVAALSPSTVSVAVADGVSLLGTPIMLIDGTPRPATFSYVVITPGYWYWDEYDGMNYWNPPVYDYKRGTVTCSPGVLSDGPHTVSMTLANGTAPTTTNWSFSVAEKPVFSAMNPASGTTTKTVNPVITAKVTDNTSVATCTASVDGIAFPVTYDSGTKVLSIDPGNLRNFANHTVSLRAVDAAGNVGTTAWTFTVNGPETTWTNVFPAPCTTLTYSPWYVGVDVTCTSPFLYTTRKVVFDGVVDSSAVWISPIKGDTKTGKIYGYPKAAAKDGTHTVTTSVSNSGGTTASYTWSFGVRVPPTMGSPSPVAKSIVTTTLPPISIPAADNSAVTSVTAIVNGVATPATYDAANGVARVSLQSPLPDDDDTTVTVKVYDALGLSVSTTWTFEVQTGAVMTGNADNCFSCHPAAYTDSTMGTPCEWCHSKHLDPSTSWHPRADITGCRPCHRSQLLIEHNRPGLTCATCHNSTSKTVKAAIAAGDTRCTTCHGDLAAAHLAVHESGVATTNLGGTTETCGNCHYPNLVTEHALANASSAAAGCVNCHPSPRDSVTSWAKDCVTAGCHMAGTSAEMHANQAAAHVRSSSTDACFASGCHADQSLSAIHAAKGCSIGRNGSYCHGRGRTPTGICLNCHPGMAVSHYDPFKHTASGTCVADCHSPVQGQLDLKTVHDGASGTNFACDKCHPAKVNSIRPWDKTCITCHPVAALHPLASHVGTDAAYAPAAASYYSAYGVSSARTGCSNATSQKTNCHDISNVAILHSGLANGGCPVCHKAPNSPKRECLDCHQVGVTVQYAGPTSTAFNLYPSTDVSITPSWTYSTTPASSALYSVVNSQYPPVNTSRYLTISSSAAGRVLFGFDRGSNVVPDNAVINQVTIYARGKVANTTYPRKIQGVLKVGSQAFQAGNLASLSTAFPLGAGTPLQPTAALGTDYTRNSSGESYYGNPKTGQRWTAAQLNGTDPVNSLQAIGIGVTQSTGGNNVSLSQVYLQVSYYVMDPKPTVGTATYHHNNAKYLNDPADAEGRLFGIDPPDNGWYEALYSQDCNDFCHGGVATTPSFTARDGSWMWYTTAGDNASSPLDRTLTLKTITLPAGTSTLNFNTNYNMGTGATGYVEASTDGGDTWITLTGKVNGLSRSTITGSTFDGTKYPWVSSSYDLSAYAGQAVKLRFEYVNVNSIDEGWAFDSLTLTHGADVLFSDDAETLKPDWTNSYWTRSMGAFPFM